MPDDINGGGRDDDRALAAEYALGLLTGEEAASFEDRLARDPSLRAYYAEWCETFSALADGADTEAPAAVKSALDRRLFGQRSPGATLVRWALGAVVGAAAAGAVAIVGVLYVIPSLTQTVLEARIEGEAGVTLTARYESADGSLTAARLEGAPGEGRDHELWLILPGQAPVSLGLLDAEGRVVADLSVVPAEALTGALLAVSDEPEGGSTTGAPTGDVLAVGSLTVL
ncbi:MAG: anti-sigma factor [Pseudomonadota bacterium]